tara:strand:+ start:293 stop:820 length:528 start_codon:yes stop_codon:yes gene_type:complete
MKTIILSPTCSGKTTFEVKRENVICNEWLSTYNYKPRGIRMGWDAVKLPHSHPLYLSWDEMYKIGVNLFDQGETPKGEYLIYNCSSHIPWLTDKYSDILIKIVLIDENTHHKHYFEKMDRNEDSKKPFIELVIKDSPLIAIQQTLNWLKMERDEYNRLAKIFNIKIYNSFEEACE